MKFRQKINPKLILIVNLFKIKSKYLCLIDNYDKINQITYN